jgi:hypothetical protein
MTLYMFCIVGIANKHAGISPLSWLYPTYLNELHYKFCNRGKLQIQFEMLPVKELTLMLLISNHTRSSFSSMRNNTMEADPSADCDPHYN